MNSPASRSVCSSPPPAAGWGLRKRDASLFLTLGRPTTFTRDLVQWDTEYPVEQMRKRIVFGTMLVPKALHCDIYNRILRQLFLCVGKLLFRKSISAPVATIAVASATARAKGARAAFTNALMSSAVRPSALSAVGQLTNGFSLRTRAHANPIMQNFFTLTPIRAKNIDCSFSLSNMNHQRT